MALRCPIHTAGTLDDAPGGSRSATAQATRQARPSKRVAFISGRHADQQLAARRQARRRCTAGQAHRGRARQLPGEPAGVRSDRAVCRRAGPARCGRCARAVGAGGTRPAAAWGGPLARCRVCRRATGRKGAARCARPVAWVQGMARQPRAGRMAVRRTGLGRAPVAARPACRPAQCARGSARLPSGVGARRLQVAADQGAGARRRGRKVSRHEGDSGSLVAGCNYSEA